MIKINNTIISNNHQFVLLQKLVLIIADLNNVYKLIKAAKLLDINSKISKRN